MPPSIATFAAVLSALVAGCAATPEPAAASLTRPASAPAAVVAAVPAPAEKRVCRRETPAGSNVPMRVCRTQAEIAQAEADARKVTGRMSDGRGAAGRPGS